jgi:hypothetical protein
MQVVAGPGPSLKSSRIKRLEFFRFSLYICGGLCHAYKVFGEMSVRM